MNTQLELIISSIKQGDIKALDTIREQGVDLTLERYLIAACHSGNLETVKYFLNIKCKYDVNTLLKKCIKFKQRGIFEHILSLLEIGNSIINDRAYMYCIEKGDLYSLNLLCSKILVFWFLPIELTS